MPVSKIKCRGGCGSVIDPDLHDNGLCEDCEEASYRRDHAGRDRW